MNKLLSFPFAIVLVSCAEGQSTTALNATSPASKVPFKAQITEVVDDKNFTIAIVSEATVMARKLAIANAELGAKRIALSVPADEEMFGKASLFRLFATETRNVGLGT